MTGGPLAIMTVTEVGSCQNMLCDPKASPKLILLLLLIIFLITTIIIIIVVIVIIIVLNIALLMIVITSIITFFITTTVTITIITIESSHDSLRPCSPTLLYASYLGGGPSLRTGWPLVEAGGACGNRD